jgi:hypothetical protein
MNPMTVNPMTGRHKDICGALGKWRQVLLIWGMAHSSLQVRHEVGSARVKRVSCNQRKKISVPTLPAPPRKNVAEYEKSRFVVNFSGLWGGGI